MARRPDIVTTEEELYRAHNEAQLTVGDRYLGKVIELEGALESFHMINGQPTSSLDHAKYEALVVVMKFHADQAAVLEKLEWHTPYRVRCVYSGWLHPVMKLTDCVYLGPALTGKGSQKKKKPVR